MVPLSSLIDRLKGELDAIEKAILSLWQKSRIAEFRNDPSSSLLIAAPPYHWTQLPMEFSAAQAQTNTRYQRWYEVFSRCHSQHSGQVRNQIKETNDYVRCAIELDTRWATEATFEGNRDLLDKRLGLLRDLLSVQRSGEKDYIIIPDTNSLLDSPEPKSYRVLHDADHFSFYLVPTVLAELDGLKRSREGQRLGEKAEKAIRVIKGFRHQGSVTEGVKVDKTITVKMIATEPKMTDLPSWLDPANRDDKILGSALETQFSQLSATVILATGDINLQNKAEMAFLPYTELP